MGRASIRLERNGFLLDAGGHVGYAVAPEHRRRGYATEILCQAVGKLGGLGVQRVLVTCDDDNPASAAVIEACGGEFEDLRETGHGTLMRRYWIETSAG